MNFKFYVVAVHFVLANAGDTVCLCAPRVRNGGVDAARETFNAFGPWLKRLRMAENGAVFKDAGEFLQVIEESTECPQVF